MRVKPLAAAGASLCGAALAGIGVLALLLVFSVSLDGAELNTGAARVAAGVSSVAAVTLAVVIGILLPGYIAARLGLPYRLTLAVSGVLFGIAAYWLLFYVSIINSCAVEVAFPFSFAGECGS